MLDLIPYVLSLPEYKLNLIKGSRYCAPLIGSKAPLTRRLGSLFLEPIARAALAYRGLTDIANGFLAMNSITLRYLTSPKISGNLRSRYLFESSLLDKIRISSFNVISILSGTGYVTDDFGLWGKFSLIFFLFLMFIGGCAGSTACGIKIFRLQMLLVFLKNQIKKLISPNSVIIVKYNNQKISDDFMKSVITFIFSFLLIFFIIALMLSLTGLDFLTAISGAASAISNVGPGLGDIIGPDGNYKDIPDISKWILAFGMLLGRLELFAILVLFFPSFWRN